MVNYHSLSVKSVFSKLESSEQGLSNHEARHRLEIYGKNELVEASRRTILQMFIDQFKEFLVLILIIAAVLSVFFGELMDAIVIGIILVINAVLGVVQEFRAEKAIQALKRMAAPSAHVIRNNKRLTIPASEVVPGDIIILEAGDKVPADARLIEVVNLKVDEASLTGESEPVFKAIDPVDEEVPVQDRTNMVFMGTSVVWGRGLAIVTHTGMNTEFGRIASLVQETDTELTPLQKSLEHFGKQLGTIILGICAVVAITGIMRGNPPIDMILSGISLAVAAIPEGLAAVVTITLALGMQRMAKHNAIVRRLSAVETLGSTSIICSDKTGTLTRNEITVCKLYANSKLIDVSGVGYEPKGEFTNNNARVDPISTGELRLLLEIGALNNNSAILTGAKRGVQGDTTEAALLVSAEKAGIDIKALSNDYKRVGEIPFDSSRKCMTTIHDHGRKRLAYVKGAPEVVLNKCTRVLRNGRVVRLTRKLKDEILRVNDEMADSALRVLAMAYKEIPRRTRKFEPGKIEKDLVFVGMQGMIDLPRSEAKDAIKLCKTAGIRVVMITGDHKRTALAVGRILGLCDSNSDALTTVDLEEMSEVEFDEALDNVNVFARISPEMKQKIVSGFKKKGFIVAVTGDGVNDAPALKDAQIGVSMGITGTDVAKEASDMILTDDNFATIVHAIKEGRVIYDNILKFIKYLLAANTAEVLIVFLATLLNIGIPLLPIQILWINLVTDGLPALALGMEPPAPGLMRRKPRKGNNVLSKKMLLSIAWIGVLGTLITLAVFVHSIPKGIEYARTMAFTTLVAYEMAVVFACRSDTHLMSDIGFFSNKWLIIAVLISVLLQLVVLLHPTLRTVFKVVPLSLNDYGVVIASASIVLVLEELRKLITNKNK